MRLIWGLVDLEIDCLFSVEESKTHVQIVSHIGNRSEVGLLFHDMHLCH